MGQRTAILIKRNFKNGTHDTRLIHYQWGFGKTMVAHFMQEFLKSQYNYDTYNTKSLKDYFKFDTRKNYIYKTSKKDVNVWDKEVIKKWFSITDNNNGGMVIEVTEEPQENDKYYYFKLQDVKIGFLLGHEECGFNYDLGIYINEEPFARTVSAEEYMTKTGGEMYCPQSFRTCFKEFCKTFDIKEVVDK